MAASCAVEVVIEADVERPVEVDFDIPVVSDSAHEVCHLPVAQRGDEVARRAGGLIIHRAFYLQHADALQAGPFGSGQQMFITGQQRIAAGFNASMLSPDLFKLTQVGRAFERFAFRRFDGVLHKPG